MVSLKGLDSIVRINGGIKISENNNLHNLLGLGNLTTVNGYMEIANNFNIDDLSGLEHLDSINGFLDLYGNRHLVKLSGLQSLKFINGRLRIFNNKDLLSLTGIDSVGVDSLTSLSVFDNPLLSECSVASVCNYLSIPDGLTNISDNNTGCNSNEEVNTECILVTGENLYQNALTISPNPFKSSIQIINKNSLSIKTISITNLVGEKIIETNGQADKLNLSNLSPGVYIINIQTDKANIKQKLIKQ